MKPILASLLVLSCCGCFNVMSHVKGKTTPYGGTIANMEFASLAASSPSSSVTLVFFVPDFPCEVVADTLTLLPWDLWHDGSVAK